MGLSDELSALHELFQSGALTAEEYAAAKAGVLGVAGDNPVSAESVRPGPAESGLSVSSARPRYSYAAPRARADAGTTPWARRWRSLGRTSPRRTAAEVEEPWIKPVHWLIALGLLLLFLFVVGGVLSLLAGPSEGVWWAQVSLEGEVGREVVQGADGWGCMGAGPYEALRPGATVKLYDDDGQLLDEQPLTNGTVEEQIGSSVECKFNTSFGLGHAKVPLDGSYRLTVAGHGVVAFVEDTEGVLALRGVVLE